MLRLRLLGEPVLLNDEGDTIIRPWRPHVALLAQLAVATGGLVSRDFLTGMLWPESSEQAARRSLRQALFRLRQQSGDLVLSAGDALQLDTQRLEIDVREFERLLDADNLAESIGWYRGPFLDCFSLPSSPAFDQWAHRERARLAGRAVSAYAQLTELATEAGDWGTAIRRARQWLALEPCSERPAERLMTLYAQTGDTAGALAFHRSFRRHLAEELGLEPGERLEALARRIRHGPSRPTKPCTPGASASPEPPLVGRQPEFKRLTKRWRRAAGGSRQLVLLIGEPGIGKTRLAQEFAAWAGLQGATTLYGRTYRIEQGVPYAALAGVLRDGLEAPGLAAVDAASLGEVSRIVPEVARRFRSSVVAPGGDIETGRVRLLEAVWEVVENLAFEAPVLLVLDDLPWADEATLAAVHYLWRRLPAHPLLLLGTARAADLSDNATLERMLRTIARDAPGEVERFLLPPLGSDAIAELAAALDIAPDADADGKMLSAVERESGGNPLFVLESLRTRAEGRGSPASRAMVRTGVAELTDGLSARGRRLLHAAAALGRRFPLPLAAAVAGLAHPDAIVALEELLERRLLRRIEYEYDFVHDLLRESVYGAMDAERRRMQHERAFQRLSPEADEAVALERASALATHASRGGLRREAYTWLLRSSDLAKAVFAGEEAEALLAQAAGFSRSAADERAVWEKTGDLRRARSRFRDAALAYQRAITYTEPRTHERLGLRIKLLDASLRSGLLSIADAGPLFQSLLGDAAAASVGYERDALVTAANAYLRTGELAAAEAYATRAVHAARRAAEPEPLVRSLLLRAQVATLRSSLDDVLPVLEEARTIAAGHTLVRELWDTETEYATELCRQGRWSEAIEGWSRVIRDCESDGAVGAAAISHLNLSDVRLRQGEWEEAGRHLDRAQVLAEQWDFPHVLAGALVNRALMAWQQGDTTSTVRSAEIALERAIELGIVTVERTARALLCLGLLHAAQVGRARQVLEPAPEPDAVNHPTWGDDRELAVVARARLLAIDDHQEAAAALVTAELDRTTEPYATALLQLELARLHGGSDPSAATRLAREAEALLKPLRAGPLLAAVAEVAGTADQVAP